MTIYPLRKFIGLFLLYVFIVFGIFVLQFRNEASFVYFIDQMKIVLTENKANTQSPTFKNRFEIVFLGLKISVTERNPARLLTQDDAIPLTLLSWETPTAETAELVFNDGIRLAVSLDPQSTRLTLLGELPAKSQLVLPFQIESGYTVTEQTPSRTIVASKSDMYSLIPGLSAQQEIVIPAENPIVSYAIHTVKQGYAFENSLDSTLASETFYNDAVTAIGNKLIETYTDARDTNEQTVVSYIAAMSERNRYAQALTTVPDTFRNSRNRTYVSAPYFNSLAEMDASLTTRSTNLLSVMTNAVQRNSLDFFTMPGLADYLLREANTRSVIAFLSVPAKMENFSPTVPEAAGILDTYASLLSTQQTLSNSNAQEYAELLESVLENCLDVIVSACSLDGGFLNITAGSASSADAEALPLMQAVDAGAALINYGTARNQIAIRNTGYFIINSLCGDAAKFDLRTLGELYPRLARTNSYYPHSTVLQSAQGRKIWAWHISRYISYSTDARGDVTISIDFPSENRHYLILKGIPPFRAIEIYGTVYRTDPRFESYNSSGYVYNAQTQTLYLKSQHKTPRETIRIIYYTPSAPVITVPPAEQQPGTQEAPFSVPGA